MRFWFLRLCLNRALGLGTSPDTAPATEAVHAIEVTYNAAMQPLVQVSVGNQPLQLVFDVSSGNTMVFVAEKNACIPDPGMPMPPCFSFVEAKNNGSVHICPENNEKRCDQLESKYKCEGPRYIQELDLAKTHPDALIIDGLRYDQKGVEAKTAMSISLERTSGSHTETMSWGHEMPVRLLLERMRIEKRGQPITDTEWMPLRVFEGTSGILGASGLTLSCRNQTLWNSLLTILKVKYFAMDFRPPPNATIKEVGDSSVVLYRTSVGFARPLLWSQPKQTGDYMNDGVHEFLMYHIEVCGIDMLFNTSSNWLAVIDTSGPCLTLPPFLFGRLMSRISVDCPFDLGTKALGRLCSPRRDARYAKLPSLSFHLEDRQEHGLPTLHFPLERLVFSNGSAELLCVARGDQDPQEVVADMMYSHIAFGSMAVAAFYTVVNLENSTIGLASKGAIESEASQDLCIPSISCAGMQTYFPPNNVCQDPDCAEYLFMILDGATKTCRWTKMVPVAFGALLAALVAIDLLSHRLYKQSIEKASESCQ